MVDDAVHQHGVGQPDQLERLWTPHRMAYVRGEERPTGTGEAGISADRYAERLHPGTDYKLALSSAGYQVARRVR